MTVHLGWIHAVYTIEDSIVFGGNFLHLFGIVKQLQVFYLEEKSHIQAKYRFPYFKQTCFSLLCTFYYGFTSTSKLHPNCRLVKQHLKTVMIPSVLKQFVCLVKTVDIWIHSNNLDTTDLDQFTIAAKDINLTPTVLLEHWWLILYKLSIDVSKGTASHDKDININELSEYVKRLHNVVSFNIFDEEPSDCYVFLDQESSNNIQVVTDIGNNINPIPIKNTTDSDAELLQANLNNDMESNESKDNPGSSTNDTILRNSDKPFNRRFEEDEEVEVDFNVIPENPSDKLDPASDVLTVKNLQSPVLSIKSSSLNIKIPIHTLSSKNTSANASNISQSSSGKIMLSKLKEKALSSTNSVPPITLRNINKPIRKRKFVSYNSSDLMDIEEDASNNISSSSRKPDGRVRKVLAKALIDDDVGDLDYNDELDDDFDEDEGIVEKDNEECIIEDIDDDDYVGSNHNKSKRKSKGTLTPITKRSTPSSSKSQVSSSSRQKKIISNRDKIMKKLTGR